MSASLIALAERVPVGTKGQREYLRYLAWRSNHENGQCNPCVFTIHTDLGCSERTARNRRRFWERQGVLEVSFRRNHTSQYDLRADRLEALIATRQRRAKVAPQAGKLPLRSAKVAPQGPEKLPPEPREDSNQEGEPRESSPPASPPAPAEASPPVSNHLSPKEAPRIVTAAPSRRIPLPDGWQPDREVRQAALANGIDPDDIREELADWWLRNRIPQGDWNATFRSFVRVARRGRPAVGSGGRSGGGESPRRPWLNTALGFGAGAAL